MNLKSFLFDYGERVEGYEVNVINEREARAAAGIQFMLGMIVLFVAIGFGHTIVARVYLTFLFLDLTIRLFTPKYAPTLLVGRFFVRNQTPEYVGALQKRFAWTLGWIILLPIMKWFVLTWDISFYKVLLCILCLSLLFFESAFSICVGCIIYKWIVREDPAHCPGGVCEIKKKEPVQMFNPIQMSIVSLTFIFILVGTYLFLTQTKSETFFGEFLYELLLTDDELKEREEKEADAEFDSF